MHLRSLLFLFNQLLGVASVITGLELQASLNARGDAALLRVI